MPINHYITQNQLKEILHYNETTGVFTKVNSKKIHLGSFPNKEAAIKARKAANIKYDFHPNHGLERQPLVG